LPVVSRAASEQPLVAIIAVARPTVRLSPVVIAIVVAGGAAPSPTWRVRVPLLVSGFVVARVEIKHRALHLNQFPRGRTPSLQWPYANCSRKGRVELDVELPEGTSVTVLALEGDETFEVDAETEQMLLQAIAQCDKGQTTPMADLVSELRSRE
jgi:hypothetical protein